MTACLEIKSLNISQKKGTIKIPVPSVIINETGVKGDAHAGNWHRQVSLLGRESIDKFFNETGKQIKYGEFGENITTDGGLLYEMKPFDRLTSDHLELEITQIGKKCHGNSCAILKEVGNCIMPREGIFARVLKGGTLSTGNFLFHQPKVYRSMIITLSDRASKGEYEDKSGPFLSGLLKEYMEREGYKTENQLSLIPDDPDLLQQRLFEAKEKGLDMVFTTGGTGIGIHDITPETVMPFLDREIPGIMEMIRTKYGLLKPAALLSRGVAGVMGKMLVFTLPGNPRAVEEYCNEIFPVLPHAFFMLAGIDNH
jgi:molybdenum cofactor synthesis domain-containing protein